MSTAEVNSSIYKYPYFVLHTLPLPTSSILGHLHHTMAPIEKGSSVLVTGINGFIGSHIADQLLEAGYKVHGTARTEAKGQWIIDYLNKKHGEGKAKLFVVPNMGEKGAFAESVKGCSGVAHVASNLDFKSDPNAIIPDVLGGIRHTLEAANSESSVKRFVFTSSSTAALSPIPDKEFTFDENTWNTACVDRAWAPPPYEDTRKWDVYGASKTQAEQELWKFQKENKPHFEINAILPNANFGPIINREKQDASTAGWINTVYQTGLIPTLKSIPPQWFVNVQDTARLHVAALVDPDVTSERIFAFAEPYNWNDVLRIMRKLRPDHKVPEDVDESRDLSKPLLRERAEEILKKNYGNGFVGLEESLKQNLEGI